MTMMCWEKGRGNPISTGMGECVFYHLQGNGAMVKEKSESIRCFQWDDSANAHSKRQGGGSGGGGGKSNLWAVKRRTEIAREGGGGEWK